MTAMKLVFPSGDQPPMPLERGTYRIGSDPTSDIVLEGDGVAPAHCEVLVGVHGVQLRVPPAQQVLVNGRAVDGLIALRDGDTIGCGAAQARLLGTATQEPSADAGDDIGATVVRPAVPRFVLRGVSGEHFGRSHPLHASMVVGRADDATLHLPLDGVSRRHARLTPADDEVVIEDLGSANGTWLNGKRITRALARHGDEVRFDSQRFQLLVPGMPLQAADPPSSASVRRTWPWVALLLVVALVLAWVL